MSFLGNLFPFICCANYFGSKLEDYILGFDVVYILIFRMVLIILFKNSLVLIKN